MDKQKRWQFYLILAVCILTLYNILPTIFYYTKPLSSSIDESRAKGVAHEVVERVNTLEEDSKNWLYSFAKLLNVYPTSIEADAQDPRLMRVTFANEREARTFSSMFDRAGSRIPFVPAQLRLYEPVDKNDTKTVWVARQIDVRLDPSKNDALFNFTSKYDSQGKLEPLYQDVVYDRTAQVALGLAGPSAQAQQIEAAVQNPSDTTYDDVVVSLAKEINDGATTLKDEPAIFKRWLTSIAQTDQSNPQTLMQRFNARIETQISRLETRLQEQKAAQEALKKSGEQLDPAQTEALALTNQQIQALEAARMVLKSNSGAIKEAKKPYSLQALLTKLKEESKGELQALSLDGRNPFIEKLLIDWSADRIYAVPYEDVQAIRRNQTLSESVAYLQERLNQLLINSLARASNLSDEAIIPDEDLFATNLNQLTGTESLLIMNLGALAKNESELITKQVETQWNPKHPDLQRSAYPILNYEQFEKEGAAEHKLGLLVYAPAAYSEVAPKGFRNDSLYVVARGMVPLIEKINQDPSAPENIQLKKEIDRLIFVLQTNGYIGYPGNAYAVDPRFRDDFIFERDDYFSNLLKATREDFAVKGSKRYAVLPFSNVEQRILAWNSIEDRIQEDLVKWKEEYDSAQVDLDLTNHYLVPAPTKNVYWENMKLSAQKYFKGDDRKILKWGLDLSGGKTVRIGLRDHNNRPVTDPEQLNQAVNELYDRINKMGVSERTIRVENNNIVLDFPGAQGLSARDLVKASSMSFHIVNEKFSKHNPALKDSVNRFLEDVWNEAVVTNRKDIESVNEIAWKHLGGSSIEGESRPRGEHAKALWDSGLRLANPQKDTATAEFNDALSTIGMLKGDDFTEWEGQSHPLEIMFFNYGLQGSSLENIHVGFDPTQGNLLSFGIKSSYEGDRVGSPRDDFYAWTSQFSEDKIRGTVKEEYSPRGWEMAVILNGRIISQPTLRAALRDAATISGRFSQREINQLAADLKAGSLSFTPRILSEQNISPELGKEERIRGILAAVVATLLVFVFMIYVYRFAGLVASAALLLNILIMWGVLQNIDAAITLPGIAGLVLTIGMAIDANVLVFERVREEFKISGRIGSAIQAGYRKAFSAIVDSNITTIIAALILIQFDSGPIRGFAFIIIIGIITSMFTALFVTRYFFAGWVQNPKNRALNMRELISGTNFDFLAQTRTAVIVSLVLLIGGAALFYAERRTIFGMDFTGGYSLTVDVEEKPLQKQSYRVEALDALQAAGATSNDLLVRELGRPNQLLIQLSSTMEEKGHPFYQLPEEREGKFTYNYEHNSRMTWLVESLKAGGIKISDEQLAQLDNHWTVMSGQFSNSMRYNAIKGILFALLAILLYITIRFEFKYAISAVIGLAYDVLVSLGIIAFLHWMGVPVQIDLQVVGAIMMIVGYSLNDTIIVFDRIREDLYLHRKWSFRDVINHALNVTLSRTTMTSGSTLMVLLTLVLLGGHSIFGFSLVMTVGVIVGTLSSLFVASPVLLYFHEREQRARTGALDYKASS